MYDTVVVELFHMQLIIFIVDLCIFHSMFILQCTQYVQMFKLNLHTSNVEGNKPQIKAMFSVVAAFVISFMNSRWG